MLDKHVTKTARLVGLGLSETFRRATTGYMNRRPFVAYDFWLRIERERVNRQWTKDKLSKVSGVSRPTINNLQKMKRPPQARVVHALADALEIDREEAEVLAGVLPGERLPSGDAGVVAAIESSSAYSGDQKQLLLDLIGTIDRANGQSAQAIQRLADQDLDERDQAQ